jgi:hypothetical protein
MWLLKQKANGVPPPGCGRAQRAGYAALLVLFFAGTGLLLLAGMIEWSGSRARLADRFNRFQETGNVAEAAAEKAISQICYDFQQGGPSGVDRNLKSYATLQPTAAENPQFVRYAFALTSSSASGVMVEKLSDWRHTNVLSLNSGLSGTAAVYRIATRPRTRDDSPVTAAVEAQLQLASLPVFQFGVFYAPDLEITPRGELSFNGRVHCNGSIYIQPDQGAAVFERLVTAGGKILNRNHPLDPVARVPGTIQYRAGSVTQVKSLNLPTGLSNAPALLHALIDLPPATESRTSLLGQQRFYNRADLIILISNSTTVATSGAYNNFSTTIPWSNVQVSPTNTSVWSGFFDWSFNWFRRISTPQSGTGFVRTNVTFFNKRENMTVQATEIDLERFLAQYSTFTALLGRKINTLFIADLRTQTGTQSGLRIIKGSTLPLEGLTVITPNPLYVEGDFNVTPVMAGATSFLPAAALVGDALTLLSNNWSDGRSGSALSQRVATSTTVNAAVIAGIVPSDGTYYSGGVENVPRLLEDWTGQTSVFRGSLVVLYYSRTATAPWGASDEVYQPPSRRWTFDPSLLEPSRLPPNTPQLRTAVRLQWTHVNPDSLRQNY